MKLFISALASLLLICPTTLALPSDLAIRQATNGPHPATIIWVCAGNLDPAMDIPDVCKNMCYGAYCRNFGTTLTWDNYTGNTKAARDANAGCERNSHCTDDLQCNVYPFDSTCDADRTDRISVNRCIPSGQNARQGAFLSQLFGSTGPWANNQGLNGKAPARFRQIFANAGNIQYCSATRVDCGPDGEEWDRNGQITAPSWGRGGPSSRHEILVLTQHHHNYRLASGIDISAPDFLERGHRVLVPSARNTTHFVEQSESHVYDPEKGLEQYDYMLDNLYFLEDVVQG